MGVPRCSRVSSRQLPRNSLLLPLCGSEVSFARALVSGRRDSMREPPPSGTPFICTEAPGLRFELHIRSVFACVGCRTDGAEVALGILFGELRACSEQVRLSLVGTFTGGR